MKSEVLQFQVMFKDDRFRSSLETSDEDKWLPSQVLTVLAVAHSLAEDLQIEVMKVSVHRYQKHALELYFAGISLMTFQEALESICTLPMVPSDF